MPNFYISATTAGAMRWNLRSVDPVSGIENANHDSLQDLDEVKRLVTAGLRFFWSAPRPAGWPEKIREAHIYANRAQVIPILIVKGIHQRNTDPHIRITIGPATAHVQLSLETASALQYWKAVGIIVYGGAAVPPLTFPAAFVRSVPRGRRGGSVSLGVVDAARVAELARVEAALAAEVDNDQEEAYDKGLSWLAGMFPN